jgi:hypothetical protein
MQGGSVAFDGRIGGHDDLLKLSISHAVDQRLDRQLVRANSVQRRDAPQQDVVHASKYARLL